MAIQSDDAIARSLTIPVNRLENEIQNVNCFQADKKMSQDI